MTKGFDKSCKEFHDEWDSVTDDSISKTKVKTKVLKALKLSKIDVPNAKLIDLNSREYIIVDVKKFYEMLELM